MKIDRKPDFSEWLTPQRLIHEEEGWSRSPANRRFERVVNDVLYNWKFSSVLELGCGSGFVALALPLTVDYVGIDKNPHCIALSRTKNPTRIFLHGDVRELLQDVGEFDVVCASAFLKHFHLDECRMLIGLMLELGKATVFTKGIADRDYEDDYDFPHVWLSEKTLTSIIHAHGHKIVHSEGDIEKIFVTVRNDLA